MSLPDPLVQDYFFNVEDEAHLFAVVFAHWLDLPQKEINALRSDPSLIDPLLHIARYLNEHYPKFYIRTDSGEIEARMDGRNLITADGTNYQIEATKEEPWIPNTPQELRKTFYQRLLKYYLSSWLYFEEEATVYWDVFEYEGTCDPGGLHFESDFYRKCQEKKTADGGYTLSLDDITIKAYFEKITDDGHLFFVIFAHWLGLPPQTIDSIAAAPNKEAAKKGLSDCISENTHTYFIQTDSGKKQAKKVGSRLITADGKTYWVT